MNELSAQAESVFLSVGKEADNLPKDPIVGFLPMKGTLYRGELMVVGRAVNGWDIPIEAAELANPDLAREYTAKVWENVSGQEDCPMKWVSKMWGNTTGYNTRRSAFWRVIRNCVSRLAIADVDEDTSWPSHLVYSNLYKVSPEAGGNPGERLCRAQESACISLLHAEIALFKPRHLLFLTGWGWAEPFLTGLTSDLQMPDAGWVEAAGTINHSDGTKTKFVIAPHPERKPETPIVDGVIAAFAEGQS